MKLFLSQLNRAAGQLALVVLAACSSGDDTGTNPPGPNPAIALSLSGTSATVTAGSTHEVTATLARSGGYSGTVTFSVDGVPAGVSGTLSTPSTSGTTTTATVTIGVAGTTSPGTYNLTVRAMGSGVSDATASFALTVQAAPAGGFTLAVSPAAVSVTQGSSASTAVAITRSGGFAGSVALTVTGAPSGLTATLNPASTTGSSSTLTLSAAASLGVGTHTLTVRGNASGQAERTATVQVSISAASGSSDEVTLDLSACGLRPSWLAVQDGTGPWTVVTPASNVYRFTIASGRGALAFPFATTFNVHHLSRAELQHADGYFCGTAEQTKVVVGTVAGLGNNDFAQIWLGGGAGNVSHPNTSFSILQVRPGSHALTGWRHNTLAEILGTPGNPDRGYVRRGLDIANNASVGVVDFEGPDSFTPASATISVTGQRTGSTMNHSMAYFTGAACHIAALYTSSAPTTTSMTAFGFPTSLQEASDFHMLTVTELRDAGTVPTGYSGGRVIQQVFHQLTNRTVALPAQLSRPTVTTLTGPYRRLQAVITVPDEYQRLISLSYNQTGSARTVNLTATPGWFGSDTATLAMPDLSGLPGWNPVWAPPAEATGTWAVQATGNNLTSSTVCIEGAYIIQASELGTF
ncbi:MAG: hypothetical protein KF785_13800 [Gemmatimonadales bacterium]|nr:hypothetical protein [Gemmatimonadales bacterium]